MRRLILTFMIGLPLGLLIIVLSISYYFFTYYVETSTSSKMTRIVEYHRHMIDNFLQERKTDLLFVLRSYTFEQLSDSQKLAVVFAHLQEKSNAFVDLGVFNKEGVHVAYHGPYKLAGKIYNDTEWFRRVMKNGYYISDIFLGLRRVPHFIIAIAKEKQGRMWVIRATIDPYLFSDFVEKVRIGKTGEAYLLNARGIFQTKRRSGGYLLEKAPETLQLPARGGGVKTFVQKDATGEKYLYATTWLKKKDWILVVRQEVSDAFKTVSTAAYIVLLISLVGGFGIILIAFFLTGRIISRMRRMDREKQSLDEQLIKASRLAELGEMAAGVAHEINNPLQIISSERAFIEIIFSDLKDTGKIEQSDRLAEIEESLHQIRLQIDRCAKITQSILQFGRQSEPSLEEIDLSTWIPQATTIISDKANVHGVKLVYEISKNIPKINQDPAQLQQVLVNLLNNAMDAVLSRHGTKSGEITIGASGKSAKKVVIWVKDNGIGISSENLKNIFRPFFTTKPVGKGTGLGLSVCYGIIENMGGIIEVSSEKGVGTTFTITLPAEG